MPAEANYYICTNVSRGTRDWGLIRFRSPECKGAYSARGARSRGGGSRVSFKLKIHSLYICIYIYWSYRRDGSKDKEVISLIVQFTICWGQVPNLGDVRGGRGAGGSQSSPGNHNPLYLKVGGQGRGRGRKICGLPLLGLI